jgi:hypothetical protein
LVAASVTTVVRFAASPSAAWVAADSARRRSSASRTRRIARRGARPARSRARPGLPARAEPHEPFQLRGQAGIEGLQAAPGAGREERGGLEAGLLGPAVPPGGHRGLHAVEGQRDEVVVRRVRLGGPRRRHGGRHEPRRPAGQNPDEGLGSHAVGRLRGAVDEAAQLGERLARPRGAGRVPLGELVAQVAERGAGAVREGHRLPDLEVQRHAGAVHAAAVLDGHEREEAQELLGAARGLLLREPGRGEVLQGGPGGGDLPGRRRLRDGRAPQRGEAGGGTAGGRLPAILDVAQAQQGEVALGLAGRLRRADRQVARDAGGRIVQERAQPRLVGVEKVPGDRGAGLARRQPPGLECRDGGGGPVPARAKRVATRTSRSASQSRASAGSVRPAAASAAA